MPDHVNLADLAITDGVSLVLCGERRGKGLQKVLGAAELSAHIGKRAQRGRAVGVRFKVVGFASQRKESAV
jgi:hypothetical protein